MISNNLKQTKKFLIPILTLVIASIIAVVTTITYLNVSVFKHKMQDDIVKYKENYLLENKIKISNKVNLANQSIEYNITKIEKKLKQSLQDKIQTALNISEYIYTNLKGKVSDDEIKQKIIRHLSAMQYKENKHYYFIYEFDTNLMIHHPMKKFINKDVTNVTDRRGQNLIEIQTKALENSNIGFATIYMFKPNDLKNEYKKINCLGKFEPLNIVIATGEYLDVIETQIKQRVLDRFKNMNTDVDNYLFFLDWDIQKDTAKFILNPNQQNLVGSTITRSYKDAKGKEFVKEMMASLEKDGYAYINYWYQKPNTKESQQKMSYFHLQKDWNWILGSGFYYDELNSKIAKMEQSILDYTKKTIFDSLISIIFITFIVIIIASYVSLKIDNTIQEYADELIDKEKTISEQSKLASMGEMIGNIAHQWRQPLSVISTASTGMIMQKQCNILDDKSFNDTCSLINTNAQYLSNTIDDFRNFIKVNKAKSEFNLTSTIHSLLNLVEGAAKDNQINIILDLDDNIMITGYQNEFIQCLINIFNNAKDILVEKEIENRLIFISTFTQDNKHIVQIKDNGTGIPTDILPKVFEPYFTTKHQTQGTGIGLNMTYNLIKGMHGDIIATTENYNYKGTQYTGAQFTIKL